MRSSVLFVGWALFALAFTAPAGGQNMPEQRLPVYGGSGGTAFSRDCGAGKVLTGLRFRDGLYVDALGLLCSPVDASGTLGPETTVGTLAGGGGGRSGAVSCASGSVVTGAKIRHGTWVDTIDLICRVWAGGVRRFKTDDYRLTLPVGSRSSLAPRVTTNCTDSSQPASGIRGRAHSLIDAIGFICDEP